MTEQERLEILKADLQLLTTSQDTYLQHLLKVAGEMIEAEGIKLTETVSDEHLRIMYAAYLYRKRAESQNNSFQQAMPRMLRWALNNRLFKQKGENSDAS